MTCSLGLSTSLLLPKDISTSSSPQSKLTLCPSVKTHVPFSRTFLFDSCCHCSRLSKPSPSVPKPPRPIGSTWKHFLVPFGEHRVPPPPLRPSQGLCKPKSLLPSCGPHISWMNLPNTVGLQFPPHSTAHCCLQPVPFLWVHFPPKCSPTTLKSHFYPHTDSAPAPNPDPPSSLCWPCPSQSWHVLIWRSITHHCDSS